MLLCVGTGLFGCQSADEPATEPHAATTIPSASTGNAEAATSEETPAVASQEQQSNPESSRAVAQFSPPFPERLELFEPPKRAQSAVRQNDNDGETVELKGFVNVDTPRVVLSIDGVVAPIAEGGEKYGVQVISIQPPSVVLQRGRSRWTATLE
jgi:hypothetical protein